MIYALDKKTGAEVWNYQAPVGINGWPAVYGDFIIFPVGLGPKAQLIASQSGRAASGASAQIQFCQTIISKENTSIINETDSLKPGTGIITANYRFSNRL
jgi:outer membrane protein assembly factor BamB